MSQGYDDCPLDRTELGRSSWKILHSMTAYFPDYPSAEDQRDMFLFIHLFAKFYPCRECGRNFEAYIKKDPPDVRSRTFLSYWMCNLHNVVNKRLRKPHFNCDQVDERWRTGWRDGSCDY